MCKKKIPVGQRQNRSCAEVARLEDAAGSSDPEKLQITPSEAVERTKKQGDLFREMLVKQQKLPYL